MERRKDCVMLKIFIFFILCFEVKAVAVGTRKFPSCKPEMQYQFQDRCCPLCLTGTFKVRDCEAPGKETVCDLCPPRTYMDEANHHDSCHLCRVCDEGAHFFTVSPCSRKTNTVCRCTDGFFEDPFVPRMCLHCKTCDQGHRTAEPCTPVTDTKCAPCPDGEYSDGQNSCLPCSRCEDQELETEQPCGLKSNTQCKKPSNAASIETIAGCLVPIFVVILVGVAAWKWKRGRQTASVDDFSRSWSRISNKLCAAGSQQLIPGADFKLDTTHGLQVIEDVEDRDFMKLMRRLGVQECKIQEVEYNYPRDRSEQKYKIFCAWLELTGDEARLSYMLKELSEMGANSAHNKLVRRLLAVGDAAASPAN